MPHNKPFYLTACILICRFISSAVGGLHYYAVCSSFSKIPICISNAPGGVYKNLQKIWFAQLLRRVVSVLVRSPLRIKTLRLVNFTIPATSDTGRVIVTCHTPWEKLLVQCLENDFAMIIAGGNWPKRNIRISKQGKGFNELRHLVKYLRLGGRVVIMSDVFNNSSDCSVKFLDKDRNVSLFPARLAKIAGVPLMAMLPEVRDGTVHIYPGPQFDSKILNSDCCVVMQNVLAFLETEIRRSPSIWTTFVREPLSKY